MTGPRAGGLRHAVGLSWRSAPGTLVLTVLVTLAGAAAPVAVAWLTKRVLDRLADPRPAAGWTLLGPAVALACAGLVAMTLPQLAQFLRQEMERAVGLAAAGELYGAVNGFRGLARFEDPVLLDRLKLADQTARNTPNQVVDGGLSIVQGGLTACGFVGAIAVLSPIMTVAVVAAAAPTLAAELALSRRRAKVFWDITPAERREFFYSRLLGAAEAAKEIRLFGIGGFLRARMLAERKTANAARRAVDRRELAVQGGLGFLGAAVAAGGLVWAVLAARAGRLSVGDIAMFAAAVTGMQGALTAVAGEVARVHQALLMIGHYVAVVRMDPDLPVPRRPRRPPPLSRGIELRDIWFRYGEDLPWVLRGLSLRIPQGRSVALVGRNGAGKSTLVKLLCRLYDPSRGAVLWDGIDLRDLDIDELRGRIGAVFQDYMCYDLTAAENIALGDLAALDRPGHRHRIERAARQAGVHETLARLPYGYETLLSRMFFNEAEKDDPRTGVELSGGQWQRLALARGLLRDGRDLVILDEPSAGLDAEAEHEVHARLRAQRAGRTSLLISHRLGAVRDADLIVVLDEGRVVERGDHDGLIAAGGIYSRLFSLQAAGYRSKPAGPRGGMLDVP